MVDFAKVKLTKGSTTNEEAVIAAISLRIILDFDISRDSARACEQRLVAFLVVRVLILVTFLLSLLPIQITSKDKQREK